MKSRNISKSSKLAWTVVLFLASSYHNVANAATVNHGTSARSSSVNSRLPSTQHVMEPAFANAGKTPGLEIWRIEDFKPVPYPKNDYGKFFSGDSYIVLSTKENNGIYSWDVHFWLGSSTSQDEAGSAAILTVQLDDQLGGDPVQHREVQDHESQMFLSYFRSGIRYLPGGVASGFTHVDPAAFESKLYQIKGKRNIRVKEVPLGIQSMNKGDCFILDVGTDIYVYNGAKSKRTERLKANSAATQIRDQDHAGRGQIHNIDSTSSEGEIQAFFNALGGGSPDQVPDESVGGDDEQFEQWEESHITLYRVSDQSGKLQIEQISQKPLLQSQLDSNDCFILDTVDANIYVWVGRSCTKRERDEAQTKAQEYLTSKNYPCWTHVVRVVEGGEPSIFRQYFKTWQGTGELHPRLIRSAAAKPTLLIEKSGGLVPEFMPDTGSGDLEVYRIQDLQLSPVEKENYGKFFGGDSYVIKYHTTEGKWIIYMWQGKFSSPDEKAASAIQSVIMDSQLGNVATHVRVAQDHEPKHFLNLFKGKMIIFIGGHMSHFKSMQDHEMYFPGESRLFCIRGTNDVDVRASQRKALATSLESDDVFIVENGSKAWIWIGKEANDIEKELANGFLELIAPGMPHTVIQEDDEPEDFWVALGGRTTHQNSFKESVQVVSEPKMFHAHVTRRGKVSYEEIHNFEQEDLDEDDVMVLDATEEIFVWIGKDATIDEKKNVLRQLSENLKRYNRENAVIITVNQGEETELFTSLFPRWNPNLFSSR